MNNRLSVVIGSGGVLCAAALGLSKALRREGLAPGMAVGCSGGSIYAATIALGYDPDEAERYTLNLFTSEVFEGYTSHLKSALTGEIRFTGLPISLAYFSTKWSARRRMSLPRSLRGGM